MSMQVSAIRESSPAAQRRWPSFDMPAMRDADPFDGMMVALSFARGEEVYGEGEPAEFLYRVKSGCVRTYKVLSDGRRQIGAFYLPGDVFGLEAGDEHALSAEAITPSKVQAVKRSALMSRAASDSRMAQHLLEVTAAELRRAQSHMLLLIKSAQERVAGFLLEMANRAKTRSEVDLPMSRQDIADYLGLTIETVSRTLTQLENACAITLPSSRHIVLRDRAALNVLNA